MTGIGTIAKKEMTAAVVRNPLEEFLLLAKGAKGAACLELIKQVLEAPGIHVFGELLAIPSIKELDSGPNANYYNTLMLFAYGTYKQYLDNHEQLLQLTPVMKKKLQHLTIVTMAIRREFISYEDLLVELDIKNVRDLEDLIIEAIYADIIQGKLDQRKRQLEVDYAISRDVRLEDIGEISATLLEWCQSCDAVLNCVEEQIDRANAKKAVALRHNEGIEHEIANLEKAVKIQMSLDSEAMSIDVHEAPVTSKKATYVKKYYLRKRP